MRQAIKGGFVECDPHFTSPAWLNFYQAIMHDKVVHVQQLKHDGTTTVYIAEVNGQRCVVKRYNTKNSWHFVRRGFRRSRADICYRMAEKYKQAGLLTPRPIAQIQAKWGPFKRRSWYICEYLQGELLSDFVGSGLGEGVATESNVPTPELLAQTQKLFTCLAKNRLSHGDMKATNLIWQGEMLQIIDLDAAQQHKSSASHTRASQKDIQRFLKNWQSRPAVYRAFQEVLESLIK